MEITKNVGKPDRVVRLALGLLLVGLSIAGVIGIWGGLGLILVLTSIVRFCPAYWLFGVRTCDQSARSKGAED